MNLVYTKNLNQDDMDLLNNLQNKGCKRGFKAAKNQNTFYDPSTNEMLYGINSNMGVSGVSDGTCSQINPLIYTPDYKCGAGTAGANPCYNNIIENMESEKDFLNEYIGVIIIILLFILLMCTFSK